MAGKRTSIVRLAGALALVGLAAAAPLAAQPAQRLQVQIAAPLALPAAAFAQDPDAAETGIRYDKATLKTDPDLESLLQKAERYLEEGNYRIATRIWQEVLNRSGDTLYSTDGEIYFSLGREVERMIARLPAEALRTYRISADAAATEVLAASDQRSRPTALARIVNEFFLSSLGDDAAFELAGWNLDAFDFVGAARLLRRIATEYPDPSVPLGEVWLRIAICQAYSGHAAEAAESLRQAEAQPAVDAALVRRVAADLAAPDRLVPAGAAENGWPMPHGNPQRTGIMPPLPAALFDRDLQPTFQFRMPPTEQMLGGNPADVQGQAALGPAASQIGEVEIERSMWERWSKGRWQPAGGLLFDERHVYCKTAVDLAAWDRGTLSGEVRWRPAWLNQFLIDDATQTRVLWQQAYGGRRGRGARSSDITEPVDVYYFGDQIAHSMAIYGDVLYQVEGPPYDHTDRSLPVAGRRQNFQWGAIPRRTRSNFLTAYNRQSGQFLWRFPPLPPPANPPPAADPSAGGEGTASVDDIGVMGPPVGIGTLLLIPVNVGGAISIYALDTDAQGAIVWRTYLTDEPAGGASAWSPIELAIDGSDVYAVCGSGALFVLDPVTGAVRFARRYTRTGQVDRSMREMGMASDLLILDGFSQDLAIPFGSNIIVLASDLNMVHGFDRENGRLVWQAPLEAEPGRRVTYLIGVLDQVLYAGGPQEVIAYDLAGEGRMIWTASWTAREFLEDDTSYGRGLLTRDALYLPVRDSILILEPATGRPVKRVGVRMGVSMPVGNLFSDGQRLWMAAANRWAALEPVPASEAAPLPPQPAPAEPGAAAEEKPAEEDGA